MYRQPQPTPDHVIAWVTQFTSTLAAFLLGSLIVVIAGRAYVEHKLRGLIPQGPSVGFKTKG